MQSISRNATATAPNRPPVERKADRPRPHPIFIILLTAIVLPLVSSTAEAQQLLWVRQFGSENPERATGVYAAGSAVIVAGQIDRGSLAGEPSAGSGDAFVRSYDRDGVAAWTRQFGTSAHDRVYGVAADASGIYVVGSTLGTFAGQTRSGAFDAFVCKLSHDAQIVWIRQFGSSADDEASAVAIHDSGIYVAGWTGGALPGQAGSGQVDAFVIRFDYSGNDIWTRQFGSVSTDRAQGIAVDRSGVYVAGTAGSALPGQIHLGASDVFVQLYDFDGRAMWTRQFGTPATDVGYGICAAASGVYVVGRTSGALPGQVHGGSYDAFVRKYDALGNVSWTKQFGGAGMEEAFGVSLDASGVYVAGRTSFQLPGFVGAGSGDAFVRKIDHDGYHVWTDQYGSTYRDDATAISVSGTGAYVAGYTFGSLPEQASAGGSDAFLARYGVPQTEPPALAVALDIMPGGCPNPLNVTWMENLREGMRAKSKMGGVIPVAVLGSENFDVRDIDPPTLSLEGVPPLRWSYEDVGAPAGGGDCACNTEGPDGILDLTLKFSKQEVIEALGPVSNGEVKTLKLRGKLVGGTAIEASDCVTIHGDYAGPAFANNDDAVLHPAAPNPFNPVTTIRFVLRDDMHVRLSVFDVRGQLVGRLLEGHQTAGEHTVQWDAVGVSSGMYFYRLEAGATVETKRMTLLK